MSAWSDSFTAVAIIRLRCVLESAGTIVHGAHGAAQTLEVADVLANAFRSLERQAIAAGARLVVTADRDLGWIHVDRVAVEQVLANLVTNAVQAAPRGVVRVHASTDGPAGAPARLRVVIEDEGPGFAREVLPRIFEPLFTTKSQGTGLGLSIVAMRVQRHGGTLQVKSEPGQGSEFLIQLPPAAARAA